MLFKSIGFDGVRVGVVAEELHDRYAEKLTRTSAELPRPEFVATLKAVGDLAARDATGHAFFVTTGVEFKYDDENERIAQIVVHGLVGGKPDVQVKLKRYGLSPALVKLVTQLCDEALLYMEGQTAQQDLFAETVEGTTLTLATVPAADVVVA